MDIYIYTWNSIECPNGNDPYGQYELVLPLYKPNFEMCGSKICFLMKTEDLYFVNIEESSFGTQTLTFEVVSETEMILQYILNHSSCRPSSISM